MNLFGLSPGELLLIMMVAMVVLGPEKLPEVAASVGKWIAEFRRATQELSEQFAADNPFAEIQRALQQVDQPAVAAPVEETPVVEEATALAAAVASAPAEPVFAPVPGTQPRTMPVAPRSDYFSRPSLYSAVSDEWTHGVVLASQDGSSRMMAPVADEWAHGVPLEQPETLLPGAAFEQQVIAAAMAAQAEETAVEAPAEPSPETLLSTDEPAAEAEPRDNTDAAGIVEHANTVESSASEDHHVDAPTDDHRPDADGQAQTLSTAEPSSANGWHAANGSADVDLNELSRVVGVGEATSASDGDERP